MLSLIVRRFCRSGQVFHEKSSCRIIRVARQCSGERYTSNNANDGDRGISIESALKGWPEKLKEAGVGDIDFNLKCLVAHTLKRKFNTLSSYDDVSFTAEQLTEFERLCEARCARMPLQHILGEWDFMDLTLKTAPTVFIPRPETEEFVAKVIAEYQRNNKSREQSTNTIVEMLEVGCGSGAMSLAILNRLPFIRSTAIERSKTATALAWTNAKLLQLEERFSVYNHTTEPDNYLPAELASSRFDLIIANPPYVKREEFPHLQPEVRIYENFNALDGGPDGLRVARLILDLACIHLHPDGKLWMELGSDHPPLVKTIIAMQYEDRLRYIAGHKDQYDRERFVEIMKI